MASHKKCHLITFRKSLTKDDYIIVYRSPKTMEITSTSLHKFPEIVISRDKLLGGCEDRLVIFKFYCISNHALLHVDHHLNCSNLNSLIHNFQRLMLQLTTVVKLLGQLEVASVDRN